MRVLKRLGVALEQRNFVLANSFALFGVGYPQSSFWGQAQHAELALVLVVVHLVRGFAGVNQCERLGENRLNSSLINKPVHLPLSLIHI